MMFKTAVAAALAACIGLTGAHAQEWAANKPIRFVVPQVTGGGADAIGRAIAKGISDQTASPWWLKTGQAPMVVWGWSRSCGHPPTATACFSFSLR